jgi:hypothetical protein
MMDGIPQDMSEDDVSCTLLETAAFLLTLSFSM